VLAAAVQHRHIVSARGQAPRCRVTDELCAADDENPHG
jgi:hypothetical protein